MQRQPKGDFFMNQLNRVKRLLAKAQQDEFEAVRLWSAYAS
jgi:hypothetical protein